MKLKLSRGDRVRVCKHEHVVPHPVPEWLARWVGHQGAFKPYPVMRCVDCDTRGEWVPLPT